MTASPRAFIWFFLIIAFGPGCADEIDLKLDLKDNRLRTLLGPDAKLEKLADGFMFIEGPVWRGSQEDGHLLFSDIPANTVYRWTPGDATAAIEIQPVHDPQVVTGAQGGSNGLIEDASSNLVMFIHGLRRIDRRTEDGSRIAIATHWQGKRLNSPNDGILHSSGAIFFTDPPYGLPDQDDDKAKEIPANGIYRLDPDGSVVQLAQMHRPNGVGLSPDEKMLYVASSDLEKKWWRKFVVRDDLTLGPADMHFDARKLSEPGVPDGFAVDQAGNIWASGPGGVVVIAPDGTHLGTILTPELPANTTFDRDEKNLYITARTGLYRLTGL